MVICYIAIDSIQIPCVKCDHGTKQKIHFKKSLLMSAMAWMGPPKFMC